MDHRFLMLTLSFFLCISALSYAQDGLNNSIWRYDKISSIDVFGHHDSNVISHLADEFKRVTIKTDGNKLTIENYFLENKKYA